MVLQSMYNRPPGLKQLLVRVTACENEQTQIKQRVSQLEQKEKATNIKDKRLTTLESQDLNKDIPSSIEGNLSDVVDNVLSERADQEKHKLNLICINMKESNKDLSSERRDEDSENLQYILMEQLGIDPNIETSDLVRLGKKNTGEQTKERPLRFKVKDLKSKNVILRAGKFL